MTGTDQRTEADRRSAAELLRAEADARAAVEAAKRAARENAEAESPASAIAALVPDLGRVDRGSLALEGDRSPLFASGLAYRALGSAAERVVARLVDGVSDPATGRILITSDAELAASDAAYGEVVAGLDELTAVATQVLAEAQRVLVPAGAGSESGDEDGDVAGDGRFATRLAVAELATVGTAVASAVAGLASLLSARRTVVTATLRSTDLAAAAAVAAALKGARRDARIVHDDIRLVPRSVVHERLTALRELRRRLAQSRLEIEAAAAADGEPRGAATGKTALLDATIAAIDAFATAIRTVPEGGSRSLLTLAALREQLHDGGARFTHLLFVQGGSGSVQQLTDDLPFWRKDSFSVVATAAITFLLLDPETSEVLSAGNASGSASFHGEIGRQLPDPFAG